MLLEHLARERARVLGLQDRVVGEIARCDDALGEGYACEENACLPIDEVALNNALFQKEGVATLAAGNGQEALDLFRLT